MKVRKIQDILTPKVITVPPDTLISDTVAIMEKKKISCIVVVENKKPVGIFTERDVVLSFHIGQPLDDVEIRELMNKPVLTVTRDADISEAYNILVDRGVRHLVVVDESDEVHGVVTQSDILNHLEVEYFVEIKDVKQIMTKKVVTVGKGNLVSDVLSKIKDFSISSVIIEEDRHPVGILTERDILRLFHEKIDLGDTRAEDVMSHPVQTISPDTPIYEAAKVMGREKVRRLVVTANNGRIKGLVAQTDIVKGLKSKYVESLKEMIRGKERELQKAKDELEVRVEKRTTELSAAVEQLHEEITERKKAEEGIIESEQRFRAIFENATDGILLIDVETDGLFTANTRFCHMLGYTLDEVENLKLHDIYPEEARSYVIEVFGKNIQGESIQAEDIPMKRKDGSIFYADINTTPMDITGKDYLVGIYRDITDKKEAVEEVRKTHNQFETALDTIDSMGEGIVMTDGMGKIDFINNAGEEMLGLTLGKYLKDLTGCKGGATSEYFGRVFEKMLPERGRWKGEFICVKDGQKRYFQTNTKVIRGEGAGIQGTITILRDVTVERERDHRLILRQSAYNFDFGRAYFTKHLNSATDFFTDLTGQGLDGAIISRKNPGDFETKITMDHPIFWLAKQKGENIISPNLKEIRDLIEGLSDSNSVSVLEGLEYLILQNSFEEVLEMVQDLNELLYMKKQGVLVFSIDPDVLEPKEYRLLTKELKNLRKKEKHLDNKLSGILRFLYAKESEGLKPTQGEVQKAVGISKMTAIRRINDLKGKGLIKVERQGRVNRIELTGNGRDFFEN